MLIQSINKELQSQLPQSTSQDDLVPVLSEFIDHLIKTDFEKLLFILYKTDVDENKLKTLLRQNSAGDAAIIITRLIIEREQQKMFSRSRYINKNDIPEEEKW